MYYVDNAVSNGLSVITTSRALVWCLDVSPVPQLVAAKNPLWSLTAGWTPDDTVCCTSLMQLAVHVGTRSFGVPSYA